jgi:hypothetical protein
MMTNISANGSSDIIMLLLSPPAPPPNSDPWANAVEMNIEASLAWFLGHAGQPSPARHQT